MKHFTKILNNSKAIIFSKFNLLENTINIYSENIRTELPLLIISLHNSGFEPLQIEIHKANIETIFLKLTAKQLRD